MTYFMNVCRKLEELLILISVVLAISLLMIMTVNVIDYFL